MKNSNLIKMFLVMVVSLCLILVATYTFADDEGTTPIDLTNSIVDTSNNTSNNTTTNTENSTDTDNFVSLDDNVSNTNTNTNSNTNSTYNSLVTTNNTNSSSYNTNNTNLPSTGLEGSGLTVALIVILAISGVYAFKKIRDYKNI